MSLPHFPSSRSEADDSFRRLIAGSLNPNSSSGSGGSTTSGRNATHQPPFRPPSLVRSGSVSLSPRLDSRAARSSPTPFLLGGLVAVAARSSSPPSGTGKVNASSAWRR